MECEELESYALDELFGDVHLMISRAKKHEQEFNALLSGQGDSAWWYISENNSDVGYCYAVVIRCQKLRELKPVVADLCNNLVHALDQLIAALTRANGRDNAGKLFFPWVLDERKFHKNLRLLEKTIGPEACDCIRAARKQCENDIVHAHLAKEISNAGKHWELVPSSAVIPAITFMFGDGSSKIFELPSNSLEENLYFEFYDGLEKLEACPIRAVIGLRLAGISEDQVSPLSVFAAAFQYVEAVVTNVRGSKHVSELAFKAIV